MSIGISDGVLIEAKPVGDVEDERYVVRIGTKVLARYSIDKEFTGEDGISWAVIPRICDEFDLVHVCTYNESLYYREEVDAEWSDEYEYHCKKLLKALKAADRAKERLLQAQEQYKEDEKRKALGYSLRALHSYEEDEEEEGEMNQFLGADTNQVQMRQWLQVTGVCVSFLIRDRDDGGSQEDCMLWRKNDLDRLLTLAPVAEDMLPRECEAWASEIHEALETGGLVTFTTTLF